MTRVLLTGANRGLGLGLARAYLARGDEVWAAVRRPHDAPPLDALRMQHGDRLRVEALDLDSQRSIDRLADHVMEAAEDLDIFISNAALTGGEPGRFGAFDVDYFLRACLVNAAAPYKLFEAISPLLERTKGKALFISSRIGANPFYGYAEYFASKTALNQLVKQASVACRPLGITVVAAHPGWVETEATAAQGAAPLTSAQAAELLLTLMDNVALSDTGCFFDPDGSQLSIVPQQHEIKFYSKPRDAVR